MATGDDDGKTLELNRVKTVRSGEVRVGYSVGVVEGARDIYWDAAD